MHPNIQLTSSNKMSAILPTWPQLTMKKKKQLNCSNMFVPHPMVEVLAITIISYSSQQD